MDTVPFKYGRLLTTLSYSISIFPEPRRSERSDGTWVLSLVGYMTKFLKKWERLEENGCCKEGAESRSLRGRKDGPDGIADLAYEVTV